MHCFVTGLLASDQHPHFKNYRNFDRVRQIYNHSIVDNTISGISCQKVEETALVWRTSIVYLSY